MKDESEKEKAEATEHWFRLLGLLMRIVDEDERKRRLAGEVAPSVEEPEISTEKAVSLAPFPKHGTGIPA